jgi:hypothetical protein
MHGRNGPKLLSQVMQDLAVSLWVATRKLAWWPNAPAKLQPGASSLATWLQTA